MDDDDDVMSYGELREDQGYSDYEYSKTPATVGDLEGTEDKTPLTRGRYKASKAPNAGRRSGGFERAVITGLLCLLVLLGGMALLSVGLASVPKYSGTSTQTPAQPTSGESGSKSDECNIVGNPASSFSQDGGLIKVTLTGVYHVYYIRGNCQELPQVEIVGDLIEFQFDKNRRVIVNAGSPNPAHPACWVQ